MRFIFVPPVGLLMVIACAAETYDYGSSQALGDPNLLFPVADAGLGTEAGACTPDRFVDAAGCSVSFRRDIFAGKMINAWGCTTAGACHGGDPPPNKPSLDALDASAAYESLRAYTLRGTALRYINPCSTDPAASGFVCNMHSACGSPMPPNGQVPDADLLPLEAWIACGAPNN